MLSSEIYGTIFSNDITPKYGKRATGCISYKDVCAVCKKSLVPATPTPLVLFIFAETVRASTRLPLGFPGACFVHTHCPLALEDPCHRTGPSRGSLHWHKFSFLYTTCLYFGCQSLANMVVILARLFGFVPLTSYPKPLAPVKKNIRLLFWGRGLANFLGRIAPILTCPILAMAMLR